MGMIKKQSQSSPRSGLSFLEFLGCLVAMVGGVILGSTYLGIDVKKMVVGVLVQSQVVDPGYFGEATDKTSQLPTQSNTETIASPEESTTANQQPAEPTAVAEQNTASQNLPPMEMPAATRAYWNALT